jgi:multisubunit Na+/H+ antiporter MnhF subunit
VNAWLAAAVTLLAGVVPCGWIGLRGTRTEALVALELATTLVTLALVLLAEGFERPSYFAVALAAAALGFIGNLVFVRFMESEL